MSTNKRRVEVVDIEVVLLVLQVVAELNYRVQKKVADWVLLTLPYLVRPERTRSVPRNQLRWHPYPNSVQYNQQELTDAVHFPVDSPVHHFHHPQLPQWFVLAH